MPELTWTNFFIGLLIIILSFFAAFLYAKLIAKGVYHGINESKKEIADAEKNSQRKT